MKKCTKAFFVAISLTIFCGCNNNGLNKPITQELTADELKVNLKNDEEFEDLYQWGREVGDWIVADNMRKAKYGDITYQQLWDVSHTLIDREKIDAQHLAMFPQREDYKHQADSILNYLEASCPDSLVKLEFDLKVNNESLLGIETKYYFWATPLKGEVEQFSYYFGFSKKIDGKKSIDEIKDKHYGTQDTPIKNTTNVIAYGSRGISVDLLEDMTTYELKRDYDFFYTIIDARYRGRNWGDVPDEIRWYLEDFRDREDVRDFAREVAIKEYIDKEYLPSSDFFEQQRDIILREKAPKILELMNEYEKK